MRDIKAECNKLGLGEDLLITEAGVGSLLVKKLLSGVADLSDPLMEKAYDSVCAVLDKYANLPASQREGGAE